MKNNRIALQTTTESKYYQMLISNQSTVIPFREFLKHCYDVYLGYVYLYLFARVPCKDSS
jgi:hypothetical protein